MLQVNETIKRYGKTYTVVSATEINTSLSSHLYHVVGERAEYGVYRQHTGRLVWIKI